MQKWQLRLHYKRFLLQINDAILNFIKESSIPQILSSTTVFNINVEMFEQHIRMISEGSCDTKDWILTGDAENVLQE